LDNVPQLSSPGLSRKQNRAIDAILKSGAAGGISRLQQSIKKIREFHPHLSGRTILRRTAELKLTSWNQPWTEVDKGYLLDHAREFPVSDLARRFRRTQNAVYLLLWKNGESGKFQDGYTRRDLAGLVHVSPRKVSRWVRLGWLTLYQGRIKDRSLRRFLEGHSDEINAERLDRDVKFWLLSLGFREDSTHSVQWLRDRKQSFKVHVCGRCGRNVHGNAIYRHLKVCSNKLADVTRKIEVQQLY
jgi:hypothetical protein